MLSNAIFHHHTIRKFVVIFGSLFKDVYIERLNTETGIPQCTDPINRILVPLSYGQKEKFIVRREQNPVLEEGNIAVSLPRMAFQMDSVAYDADRKLTSIGYNSYPGGDTTKKQQYNPVPYNFMFSLWILTDSIEDTSQILEQVLPFFKPEFTVTGDMIPEMGIKHDIPIILNSVANEDTYDTQDFQTKRVITWNLQFTLKGYIYGPIKDVSIIRKTLTDVHLVPSTNSETPITDQEVLTTPRHIRYTGNPDPITAGPGDAYEYVVTTEVFNDGKKRNPVTGEDEEIP